MATEPEAAIAAASASPDAPAPAAAPARGMRERPAKRAPLLERGGPEPVGLAKRRKAPAKKKKSTSGVAAGKKGKAAAAASAVAAGDGGSQVGDTSMAAVDEAGDDEEDDNKLFCICLGKDDGSPMIGCEGCENWFHLACLDLTEEQSAQIATYYCALCEQAGSGTTEWLPSTSTIQLPAGASASLPVLPPIPQPMTPSDSGGEYEDADYLSSKKRGQDSDDDYAESGRSASRKRKDSKAGSSVTAGKKKRRVVEDDDDREEKEMERESKADADTATIDQETFYDKPSASKKATTSAIREGSAANNKTRRYCLDTLVKTLEATVASHPTSTALQGSSTASEPTALESGRIQPFAEAVEEDLFQNHSEIDPATNKRLAKTKYIAKFRTLLFNLKSNTYFRSRIASGTMEPSAVVNMSQEDLLTPEARKEQEAIKQQSLAQSVKIATAVPKTRMTHKGEEVLDEFDPGMMQSNRENRPANAERQQADLGTAYDSSNAWGDDSYGDDSFAVPRSYREQSMSSMPAASPRLEQQSPRFGSPSAMSPGTQGSSGVLNQAMSPVDIKSSSRKNSLAAGSPGASASPQRDPSASPAVDLSRPPLQHHSRSDSLSKSRLDLDKVWGSYKSPAVGSEASPSKEDSEDPQKPKDDDDMDTESDEDRPDKVRNRDTENNDAKHQQEDYDPFAVTGKSTADEDFDALMGSQASADNKATEPAATADETTDNIASLPTVWSGTLVNLPEEAFPVRLVQVGGQNMGIHPHIWDQILPKGALNVTARIEVKSASDYLIQIRFASSRELIVLAFEADGDLDPVTQIPGKPSMDTLGRYSNLVNLFRDKKRYGVCPPLPEMKQKVKDHYIVPLRKNDPLPDYIELLDDHLIPETGSRTKDYLLSVLVLQKGSTTVPKKVGGTTPQAHAPMANPASTAPLAAAQIPPPQGGVAGSFPAVPSFASPLGQPGLSNQPLSQAFGQQPQQPVLPALDPLALQGLLSNPGLLQALGGTNSPAPPIMGQMSPPPGMQQNFGVNFSQPQLPFGQGQTNSSFPHQAPMQQGSPPWQQQQQGFPPQSGMMPQNQWNNPAGSPTWQGGPPNQGMQGSNPGWRAPLPIPAGQPPPPSGAYIDPERIRQASLAARELGQRNEGRDSRSRSGNNDRRDDRRDDRRSYSRSDGRDRRDDRGDSAGQRDERAGRRNSDYASGPRGREKSATNNQMHAGIRDKGWGRRG